MVKFSIIVPCYNLEKWIRDCLNSVQTQSYENWECIVVDDESKDGSPVICDEYASRDSRIKVVHQSNAGEGGARNTGLATATGDWIFFLDGDDVMAPGSLALLAQITERFPNEKLIRFGYADFDDGAALPYRAFSNKPCGVIDISRHIDHDDFFVYVWQFIFRREMIAGMLFKQYKRGADRTFIIPVLCSRVQSFVATEEVCYFYRNRLGSAINSRASVQVMKDELSHRLDIIEMIDRCDKTMPYKNSIWLERFCVRDYLRLVENTIYSKVEQRQLVAWFYVQLPRIRHARGFSCLGKINARLYCVFRGPVGRHVVLVSFPKLFHWVRSLIARADG